MRPEVELWGIGGEMLRAEGMETLVDAAAMNVIGFVEVLKRYRYFRSVFNSIVEEAKRRRPALAILVDYPGFNLRLARVLHEAGVRVVYYIAPQVWAWKEGRVRAMRENIDDLIVAFPFETAYFGKHGIPAHFFGHPLVDQVQNSEFKVQSSEGEAQDAARYTLHAERPRIAYLPGSRPEEIERHMPILCEVMLALGDGYRHVIPLASTISRERIERFASRAPFEIVTSAHEALAGARAAVVKSGTSTLDATLLGVPFAVIYRTSAISYRIARRMIKVPFIAMPNVLAGRVVVREFVQDDVRAEAVTEELRRLIAPGAYREGVVAGLRSVSELLGAPGAAERVADFIVGKYLP